VPDEILCVVGVVKERKLVLLELEICSCEVWYGETFFICDARLGN
jgi:hypothetical protein